MVPSEPFHPRLRQLLARVEEGHVPATSTEAAGEEALEGCMRPWKAAGQCGRLWKAEDGGGRLWKAVEEGQEDECPHTWRDLARPPSP